MKLETFSYLPQLSEAQIRGQVQYIIRQGYAPAVEYTDEPDAYNNYWTMWGLPMFEARDAAAVIFEVEACKRANPGSYVKVNGFDKTRQAQAISFVVYAPPADAD
ncbi:MAG: ribulose bisphosphate carboxylase small subunit [Chloroflexota bacterium]|nr:ribulose bisphosphate carboxylase small subunit [Chloroflexota bacterium]